MYAYEIGFGYTCSTMDLWTDMDLMYFTRKSKHKGRIDNEWIEKGTSEHREPRFGRTYEQIQEHS